MSYENIRAALEIRLNSVPGGLRTQWENATFTPAVGEPYQRANLLPAESENPALGSSLVWETGVFQVALCYPRGAGAGAAMARSSVIRAYFQRGLTLTQSGTRVLIHRTPSIGPAYLDGDRYVVPVSIRYIVNEF